MISVKMTSRVWTRSWPSSRGLKRGFLCRGSRMGQGWRGLNVPLTSEAVKGDLEGNAMEKNRLGLKSIVIGVGDYYVSSDKSDLLVTYALGSCVGVTAYDAKAGTGGVLHFKLPHSELNPGMAAANPALFGDTGLEMFLKRLFQQGATRPYLEIKLAGASKGMSGIGGVFTFRDGHCVMA